MGRRPRKISEYYRSIIWFSIISESIGSSSPRYLERLFQPENLKKNSDGKMVDSRSWDKYKKGERLPKDGFNEIGKPYAVCAAESTVPDSAYIYRHPIWNFLRGGGGGYLEAASIIYGFGNYVRRYYFKLDSLTEKAKLDSFGELIGELIFIDSECNLTDVFDHLCAQLIILRMIGFRHRDEHLFGISENLVSILRCLAGFPSMRRIYPEFFDYLEKEVWQNIFEDFNLLGIESRSGWRKIFP